MRGSIFLCFQQTGALTAASSNRSFQRFGIPSFIAFRDGEESGRFVSKDRKTQEEIENFIAGLGR
ncbi:Uncharacterised protein [Mycobacteroides abscessus subsp. abscessus]|nr:Uncharacterised protein [Mycobacteroides abscessus subsp. abscessus]